MTGASRPGRRRSGGTGRRAGLKIPCPQGHEGSTPSSGTNRQRKGSFQQRELPFFLRLVLERGSNGQGAPTNRRKSATHGSATAPSPAAKADGLAGRGSGGRVPPPALTHWMRTGEDRRAISEEKRDARERGRSEPRRKGRSHGGAAPLPNVLRSLGYPATNRPRGKAQAGESSSGTN